MHKSYIYSSMHFDKYIYLHNQHPIISFKNLVLTWVAILIL